MYFVVPQIILFREEHSPRTLVNKVDFISAPGFSDENIYRPGGPKFLLTNRALFKFNKQKKRFCLLKIHNNESLENVVKLTGFKFDVDDNLTNMSIPNENRINILRSKISYMVSEFYPEFADRIWGV
jgi:glutaconate CoA-transferase subunit B